MKMVKNHVRLMFLPKKNWPLLGLKSYVFCFYSFQKIETIRPHVCMYTLHSDEVVSLISGDYSVVGSPMQWMLQSMCCYKTVDLY